MTCASPGRRVAAPPAMTTVRLPSPLLEARGPEVLREAADQADRGGGAECRPVVLIHLIPQAGVADLVQARELIEAVGAAIRHQQSMEGHGQPCLAERLHRLWSRRDTRTRRNDDLLAAVRIDRVRDQAVHRCGAAAVEPIGQHRVDDRAFEDSMQRTGGTDRIRVRPCGRLPPLRRRRSGDAGAAVERRSQDWRCATVRGLARAVARTTASAISIDGRAGAVAERGGVTTAPLASRRAESGRSSSGRRLSTTLLANRLSYSRRLRSATIGSGGRAPLPVPGQRRRRRTAERAAVCASWPPAPPVTRRRSW